ncbi:unnamed protein product [Wuchereria bancrofti]|uniref:Uncharacterized protein n=1 Tax=Wuchereria bancrofti TaxID=6293 RepID=A0A3P7G9V4_WUCBA|nr:unnamed protein product [Wuchereria bancrofti]
MNCVCTTNALLMHCKNPSKCKQLVANENNNETVNTTTISLGVYLNRNSQPNFRNQKSISTVKNYNSDEYNIGVFKLISCAKDFETNNWRPLTEIDS